MSWVHTFPLLAVADWWDTAAKIVAAVAVVAGPTLVVLLTRRGSRADRFTVERTEVEKLYIDGTSHLLKHQHEQITALTAELATTKSKLKTAQEEVDTANRSFAAYQEQYNRLVKLLDRSGIPVPPAAGEPQP